MVHGSDGGLASRGTRYPHVMDTLDDEIGIQDGPDRCFVW